MACTSELDGVKDAIFNCSSKVDANSLRKIGCVNETFDVTYVFQFQGVSTFVLFCESSGQMLFNNSISISVVPAKVTVSHTTYESNLVILHFSQFEDVENMAHLQIKEMDGNGHVQQLHQIDDATIVFSNSTPTLTVDHPFTRDHIYSLVMTFQNGIHATELEAQIIIPTMKVSSLKKLHFNPNTEKLDALFNVTVSPVFVSLVNDEFKYDWNISGDIFVTSNNVISKKFPLQASCYECAVNITNENVTTARLSANFCLQVGINVTLEYTKGIKLGDVSEFTLTVDQMGPESCLMLEFVGANKSVLFTIHKEITNTTNTTQSNCITRGLTDGKELSTRSMYNNSKGLWVGSFDHLFETEGQFEVKMIAENEVTSQVEIAVIDVININCRSPDIEIIGNISFA